MNEGSLVISNRNQIQPTSHTAEFILRVQWYLMEPERSAAGLRNVLDPGLGALSKFCFHLWFFIVSASVFLFLLFFFWSIHISIPGEEIDWPRLTEGLTWFNSHGQRRQGHVAHSGHQSPMDMKKASSGKESSADCGVSPLWHGGSVPSQGQWGDICDIQCATAE